MIVICVKTGLTGSEVSSESQKHKNLHKWEEVLVRVVLEEAENQWRSLSPLSVSPFVVWFLWNNLIKVAGWLNSEWKLGYICLSFPLKSSFPPSDAPSSSHFHQLSLFERRKLPLSHYFHNYFSGCQEIRLITIKKGENVGWSDFDLPTSLHSNTSWKTWFLFKGPFHLQGFWHNSLVIWLVAWHRVKEGEAR